MMRDLASSADILRVAIYLVQREAPGELAKARETLRASTILMARAQAETFLFFSVIAFSTVLLGAWLMGFLSLALSLWGASWVRTERSLRRPWCPPVVSAGLWRAPDPVPSPIRSEGA